MSVLGTGCRLTLAVIATLVWTDNLAQEERGVSRVYWLNIPSQPLEGGLLDLARQTGIQIVFFSRLIKGKRASAVQGPYTIDAALTALLAGSGLTFRVINERTIEITAPGARAWNELHLSSGSVESVYEEVIARTLNRTVDTARWYVKAILMKLDAAGRVEAVAVARRRGLLPDVDTARAREHVAARSAGASQVSTAGDDRHEM